MPTSVNANQKNSYSQAFLPLTQTQKASQAAIGFVQPWVDMGQVVGNFALTMGQIALSPSVIGLATSSYVLSSMLNIPMRQVVPAQLISWGAGTSAALITAIFFRWIAQSRSPEEALTVKKQDSLVETVTGANFKKEVLQSKMPVVVDAYATWCPPCKAVAPVFASLSSEMRGKVKFVKFNVDEEGSLAKDLNIEAMPTFLFYKNGQCAGKHAGAMDRDGFKAEFVKYFL
jgi:thioredoxin 1